MIYAFQDLGYQVTIGDLRLYGEPDDDGVAWGVRGDVEGWDDSADTTLNVSERIWGNGTYSNNAFDKGKSYVVNGQFTYPDVEAYHAACARLKKAVSNEYTRLIVNDHGVSLQTLVKRETAITFKRKAGNWVLFTFQLHADSPYRYASDSIVSGSTGLPSTSGGFTYPYQFENGNTPSQWVFDETVISGKLTLTSHGSAPSNTIIRIDGPVVNPRVEHQATGRAMSAQVTLGAGHYLLFDMGSRQILEDGTNPRQAIMQNRQWQAALQGENTWLFSSADNSTSARLTVSFREAYL